MVKSVVITNVFGARNRGDAALVEALVDHIQRAFPEALISGIANDVDHERNFLPEHTWLPAPFRAKGRRFQRVHNIIYVLGFLAQSLIGVRIERMLLLPSEQKHSLCAIRDADLVVSCAGGFLLDINLSYYMNLMQLYVSARYETPFIVSPQTIGPVQSKFARWLGRFVLGRAAHIFVREDYSMRFMAEKLKLSDRVEYFPDLALSHGRRAPDEGESALRTLGFEHDEVFIAASVLDWAFPGAKSKGDAQADYERRFADAVIQVLEAHQCRVLFINQVSSDLPVARRVAAMVGDRAVVDEEDRLPSTIRGMLAHANLMIASRFHSCIFGMLEGTPIQAVSYNYKTDGIMAKIGLSDRVWKIDSFKAIELGSASVASFSQEKRYLLDESQAAGFWQRLQVVAKRSAAQ